MEVPYAVPRPDGEIEYTQSMNEAISLCPFLGKLPLERARVYLEGYQISEDEYALHTAQISENQKSPEHHSDTPKHEHVHSDTCEHAQSQKEATNPSQKSADHHHVGPTHEHIHSDTPKHEHVHSDTCEHADAAKAVTEPAEHHHDVPSREHVHSESCGHLVMAAYKQTESARVAKDVRTKTPAELDNVGETPLNSVENIALVVEQETLRQNAKTEKPSPATADTSEPSTVVSAPVTAMGSNVKGNMLQYNTPPAARAEEEADNAAMLPTLSTPTISAVSDALKPQSVAKSELVDAEVEINPERAEAVCARLETVLKSELQPDLALFEDEPDHITVESPLIEPVVSALEELEPDKQTAAAEVILGIKQLLETPPLESDKAPTVSAEVAAQEKTAEVLEELLSTLANILEIKLPEAERANFKRRIEVAIVKIDLVIAETEVDLENEGTREANTSLKLKHDDSGPALLSSVLGALALLRILIRHNRVGKAYDGVLQAASFI